MDLKKQVFRGAPKLKQLAIFRKNGYEHLHVNNNR